MGTFKELMLEAHEQLIAEYQALYPDASYPDVIDATYDTDKIMARAKQLYTERYHGKDKDQEV